MVEGVSPILPSPLPSVPQHQTDSVQKDAKILSCASARRAALAPVVNMQSFASSRLAAASLRAARALPEVQASSLIAPAFGYRRSFHYSRSLNEGKKIEEKSKTPSFAASLQGSTSTRLQRERSNEARYLQEQRMRKREWGPNTIVLGIGESDTTALTL